MHTVKPLDRDAIARAAAETGAIVVAEEHLVDGGLGVRVAQVVAETNPCVMEFVGIHDRYAESGQPEELLEKYGLVAPRCRRGRSQSASSAEVGPASGLSRPMPCPTALSDAFLDQSPACHWIVGSRRRLPSASGAIPPPFFGKSAADLAGPRLSATLPPELAAPWKDRFSRALAGEILQSARAPRRRCSGTSPSSRSAWRARSGMPAAWRAKSLAWHTAEQELRHTVLGALKAQEFERSVLSKFLHD